MTITNLMLGTGPLIVPCVFLIGGYLLASIFIVIMGTIATISGMFCVEALAIANALRNSRNSAFNVDQSLTTDKIDISSSLL